MSLLGGALTALATSLALTPFLVIVLRRIGVVDRPATRSLHTAPVPRGGGLVLLGALAVGLIVGISVGPDHDGLGALWLLASVVLYAALGLNDDLSSLSAGFRLAIQAVGGLGVGVVGAAIGGWEPVWILITAVALVSLVNITNFMDGADGVASWHAIVCGGWFAILALMVQAPTTALFATCLAGAALGFVPFNAFGARIFLGDVGSYLIGAAMALIAVVLIVLDVHPVAVGAPLGVYVLDTLYTLQLRMRAGQRWYEPHKLHIYQRLVSAGWSHQRVSALVAGTALLLCLLAVPFLLAWPLAVQVMAGVLMVGVALGYLRLPVWAGAPEPWRVGVR